MISTSNSRRTRRTLIRLSKSREHIFHGHRGKGVFLDAFSPRSRRQWGGHGLGDPAYYLGQARLPARPAADEPPPTLIRTPAAPRARRARRSRAPRPVPMLVRAPARGQSSSGGLISPQGEAS